MECHNGAVVSNALNMNVMQGHLPPEAMTMQDSAPGFQDLPPQLQEQIVHQQSQNWANEFEFQQQMHHQQQMAMAMQQQAQQQEGDWGAQFQMEQEFQQRMESEAQQSLQQNDWTTQFQQQEGQEWAADYNNDKVQVFGVEGEPIRSYEEKMKDSQFYDFMSKVRSGEVIVEEGTPNSAGGEWVNDYANGAPIPAGRQVNDAWTNEMMANQQTLPPGAMEDEEDEYRQAWEEAGGNEEEMDYKKFSKMWGGSEDGEEYTQEYLQGENMDTAENWMQEYEQITKQFEQVQDSTEYPFDPDNPYLFHDAPFEEGIMLLNAGTISEAVLAFEAACQKEPKRADSWQNLGTTQAENEKDQHAIKALNKARQLDPKNFEIHLALSVSHTNESNHALALHALRDWIQVHDEYNCIAGFAQGMTDPGTMVKPPVDEDGGSFVQEFMFVSPSEHREVASLFEAAVEMFPQDVNLWIGLGIIRNLSHEYDKAAEAFQNGLKLNPNDAKMWNKLGATLANGSRSREALAAYERALDLKPGYVRAQYNLGISYGNLGEHDKAAKQFIRSIVMQQGGVDCNPANQRSTRELWDVLRMTLNLMDRPDLVTATWKQDVKPFLEEFGLPMLQ